MGNWRTINILGTVPEDEVKALREACEVAKDYSNFHCLSMTQGLAGLGNWVGKIINARGNLAERGYNVESVANRLKELLKVAPHMELKVHCGGDYESNECIKTITVKNGKVKIGEPEVKLVSSASDDEMKGRFYATVLARRQR